MKFATNYSINSSIEKNVLVSSYQLITEILLMVFKEHIGSFCREFGIISVPF